MVYEGEALAVLVEIGQGTLVTPGWEAATVIDPIHGQGEMKRLAQDVPWPIDGGTVERIRASHVMEHIPSGAPRIDVMNEAHRVLRTHGTFEIIVPGIVDRGHGLTEATGSAGIGSQSLGWQAIADPTHVSYWVPESFHYFDGLFAANASYGILQWNTLHLEVLDGWEIHWIGEKP